MSNVSLPLLPSTLTVQRLMRPIALQYCLSQDGFVLVKQMMYLGC